MVDSSQALRESEARFRMIFEHAATAIVILSLEGKIISSNPETERILGYMPQELQAKSIRELSHPEDFPACRRAFLDLKSGNLSSAKMEKRYIHKSGKIVWCRLIESLARDAEGQPAYIVAMLQDITREKEVESRANQDTRQALQDRDEFMAIASHELRTPITPLKMQLQFLIRHLSTGKFANLPEAGEVLKIIQISEQQLDRLSRLIEDMLHASRMNATGLSLSRETVELSELLAQAVERYQPEATRVGCVINLNLSPEQIVGDWDRFRLDQLIVNLLTNAMKYGKGKPVEVSSRRNGSHAVFSIRDHGIGIDPRHHEKIFEQFHRVGTTTAYGGFGLGLFIARQIVAAHGGKISVQSALGEGAILFVELPLGNLEK